MSEKTVKISNVDFPFDKGVVVLKHRHKNENTYKNLEGIWDSIEELTVQTALSFTNIEQRRIAIGELGIEQIVSELSAELISRETIHKSNMYINPEGEFINNEFDDTYELYKISGSVLWGNADTNGRRFNGDTDVHFVKCKCTSTDREYLIWVHENGIKSANGINDWNNNRPINAIQAIAWTIQTNVPKGKIEKIIRQGDCIFVKPFKEYYEEDSKWVSTRHISEEEYRTLLVAES